MITFRDFMESSLYDPKEGFYAGRLPVADFYTAPELHPVFAEILTGEICRRLAAVALARPKSPLFIVEMGSGNGTLARQILDAIRQHHPQWLSRTRYILVERVEHLLLGSILRLQDTGARLLGYSRMEEMQPLCGVFFSNELVDAMPVHVLEKRDGRMWEVYVEKDQGATRRKHENAKAGTRLGLLSNRALVHAARAVRPFLADGDRHAVNLEARAWMQRLAVTLKVGSVITIDYGARLAPGTPNPPRAYFRHSVGDRITNRAGRQDLTASVDFSQLIDEGKRSRLSTTSFQTMGRFLINNGILDRLPSGSTPPAYKERTQIKTLFHPDGMGDRFKVLIQEKGLA